MTRVLLLDMPFGDVHCPSLALGLFKTRLQNDGIECDIEHLKLFFASMVGWENYVWQAPLTALLAGERTFARAFFGAEIPSDAEYFDYAGSFLKPDEIRKLQHISAFADPFLQTCIANIPWHQYDIIGFTSMFEQNLSSLALAYEVKRRFPKKVIVFGGANCEDVMGQTLHRCFPFVDYVCCGEADRSFPELVKRLARGEGIEDVPGIVYREGGSSVFTGESGGTTDMDELPYPNYDDYFRALKTYGAPEWLYPSVLVEASRGCWWGAKIKCTFCGLNGTTVQSRAKGADRVLDEITWLVERYRANYVRMVDNMLNPEYFDTLLPALESRNQGVRFFFEIRPTLRKEQMKSLASAGAGDIQAGIENLSTNVLRLMKKGSSGLSGIQTLRWCKQYDVYADWNIIFGFPGEQPGDYERNFDLVRLLTHLNPPGGIGRFRMDRFSTNFERAEEMGFTDVRPARAYRYIYPFSEKTLSDLVYFFDYTCKTRIEDGGYLRRLSDEITAWRSRQDELTCSPSGDALELRDTRRVAAFAHASLTGIRKDVIEYCDRAHTLEQIHDRLIREKETEVPKDEIKAILDEFVGDNLMVREGSWYLSLPIMKHLE